MASRKLRIGRCSKKLIIGLFLDSNHLWIQLQKKNRNSGAYFSLDMVYEYKKVSNLKNWSTIKSQAVDCLS